MFFGLTIEKILLIGVIAALVVGPERLPRYAEALANATKKAREWISNTRTRMKDEIGEDFQDVDWRTLDPRQYDPRRIIREALLDDAPVAARVTPVVAAGVAVAPAVYTFTPGEPPPYDNEAT